MAEPETPSASEPVVLVTATELDEFIKANGVDSRAAADFRECPPEMQRKVLDRGDLSTARNTSAALIARIRDARNDIKTGSNGRAGMGLPSTKEVDDFIEANSVSAEAAEALRSTSPTVKRQVLNIGGCKNAEDPSGALLERIKEVKAGGEDAKRNAEAVAAEMEEFIKKNDLDDRAAGDLRECTPAMQRAVLDRGELVGARNPSSAALSRIRDARMGLQGGRPRGTPAVAAQAPQGAYPHSGAYGYYGAPPGYPGYPGYFGYPGYAGYPPAYPGQPGAYGYPPGSYAGYPPGGEGAEAAQKSKADSRSSSYSYSGSSSYSSSSSQSQSDSQSQSQSGSRDRKRGRKESPQRSHKKSRKKSRKPSQKRERKKSRKAKRRRDCSSPSRSRGRRRKAVKAGRRKSPDGDSASRKAAKSGRRKSPDDNSTSGKAAKSGRRKSSDGKKGRRKKR